MRDLEKITLFNLFVIVLVASVSASRSSKPLIKNIFSGGSHFEGPSWAEDENAIYWVDISAQNVLRMDFNTRNVTIRHVEYGPVSLVVTVKDYPKLVLITVRSAVYLMDFEAPEGGDAAITLVSVVDVGHPENRANDGKVDAMGRLWFGTMGNEVNNYVTPDQATLYKLDYENYLDPTIEVRPVTVSNGIAWTADNKYMFYIDTPTLDVSVFDFDLEQGSISNRRALFNYPANNVTGVPDGMTIDTDGNLWVACFGGGKVIKIDSRSGKLLEEHRIPAQKVTSVMFGGPDLATLFVTTSKLNLSPAELAQQPQAGSLFAIEGTGARGYPQNKFIFPDAKNY